MSVYQANGRPLSQQALYQQKLRQGVFNTPGKPSVGVSLNASDAAALLAALSDLTVKPSYERLHAAPEAHNAALAVKHQPSKAWSRDATDPHADAAALSAKLGPGPAAPKSELGIPATYNKGSVYKQASANLTSTMTSRTTPEKLVLKHGLASKSATFTSGSLNIGKISQLADKNSSSLLNKRFNPEQDYRLGVAVKPAEFLTEDEERMAAQSADRSLTMRHGAGYTDSISAQKRTKTFQAADVVDATLIAAASAKAAERLNSLKLTSPLDLKEQVQLYSKALAAAQKNSEDRIKSHKAGVVDLGGGLTLPIGEVDKLASLIVQPVLDDLTTKADAQREIDSEQLKKRIELTNLHLKFKREEESRKIAERNEREKAKQARIEANEAKKKEEDDQFVEYQKERNGEIHVKNEALRELKEQHATEKEELLKEKQENEERIEEEETGLINGRKEELEKMQAEKDEILKPTLEELEVETSKLKDLTDSKDQLTTEVESAEKQKADYTAKIEELKRKLEETRAEIEAKTTEHEETVTKRETTDKEVEELKTSHAAVLKESEETHKDLDLKIEQLDKEKAEHTDTKAAHKKEILLEIDEKVKGEHEINKELPEHLQESIDESKHRDVGSLFSVEEPKKEPVVEKAEPVKKEEPVKPAPIAVDITHKKKSGFRSRISGLKNAFKNPAPPAKTTATSTKKTAPATVASTLQKDKVTKSEKAAPVAEKKAASAKVSSEDSNIEDELLIKNNSKNAGVFKEEI